MMWMMPGFLRTKIGANEIYKIIFDKFGTPNDKRYFIFGISDKWFNVATKKEIESVIKEDHTDGRVYIPEVGDCDNFAFELRAAFGRMGWPVGIFYVETPFGMHAVFFYIDENKALHVVEPQDDNSFDQINKVFGVIMY